MKKKKKDVPKEMFTMESVPGVKEELKKAEKDPKPKKLFKPRPLGKGWFSYLFRDRLKTAESFVVKMELVNGMHTTFLMNTKDGKSFRYKKKKYLIDSALKYYDISAKYWCFDYHEEFALPIKRNIPIGELHKTLTQSGLSEIDYATNPATLEQFVVSRIAEGVMKGQQIDAFFQQIRLLVVIICIATVGHLLLFMFKTGMLSSVPGLG